MDYYVLLGILPTATSQEIQKAYRKMAQKYHPDRNIGKTDDVLKFQSAKEAYEILSNPEKRRAYDESRNSKILPDPRATAREIWENFIYLAIS